MWAGGIVWTCTEWIAKGLCESSVLEVGVIELDLEVVGVFEV
jgi:hypothetical protein